MIGCCSMSSITSNSAADADVAEDLEDDFVLLASLD